MKIGTGILMLGMSFLLLEGGVRTKPSPLFFTMDYHPDAAYDAKPVAEYDEEGLMEPFQLDLISEAGQPLFYSSSIRTTVCDDEVCEIMHVQLFWDLTGNYVGYDTIPGHALTKFDHEPFISEDYVKLHELLSNEGSILKFKTKEELIDKQKVKASDVVDGTTGATALEIREEVVEGALYTSYTIWHIAYKGDIKNMLTQQTGEIYNEALKEQFLNSDRSGYQLFAIERFTEEDFMAQRAFLLKSMKEGIPLLRKFILNDMPRKLWQEQEMQSQLCGIFSDLDVNSKTLLLAKLNDSDQIHSKSLQVLSGEIRKMNKNQLISFLSVLNRQGKLEDTTLSNLRAAAEDGRFQFSYLIEEQLGEKLYPPG